MLQNNIFSRKLKREERIIKRFFKILNRLVLGALIIILICIGYSKYVCQDYMVKIGDYGIFILQSESMEPTIQKNELIIIKKDKEYDLDDIVTYIDVYANLITHRIVQIDEYSFISKGDANKMVDNNTDVQNIEGKVVFHSIKLGIFIVQYFKFIILIYIIILLIKIIKNRFTKESKNEKIKKK